MVQPVINNGTDADGLVYSPVLDENFTGANGPLSNVSDIFKFLDMSEGLHRAGNVGLNGDGSLNPNDSVNGKRWNGWYNDHQDTVTRIENNRLVMGGLFTNEPDPTRVQYSHPDGSDVRFDLHKVFTSFLTTWDRVYSNDANNGNGGFINDPNHNKTWGPNHYFEFSADISGQKARAFRWSAYLLAADENASNNYDGSILNGVENDWPEVEFTPGFENHAQVKVISGEAAGNTPNGSVDVSTFGIDMRTGFHTYGLQWEYDFDTASGKFIWYIDGVEVQRDEVRVPNVAHYVVFSREFNTGAKTNPGPGELQANPPFIPQDVGLFAANGWIDRAQINSDVVVIDYLRIWAIDREISGKIRRPPLGTIKQRIPFSFEPENPDFDLDAYDYEWTHDISASANPSFDPANHWETELKFTGTLSADQLATINCEVTPK